MSLELDEHREYLADEARVSAFSRAIAEAVRPGHVVLDLGSGTGILGLLACRAGAKRVYSIESGGMIEVARDLVRANGFQDRVVFVHGYSKHVDLPEPVDVIVSDQIGHFGFEAGVLDYFGDARRRFLKPSGVTVPRQIDLCLAAVECPDVWSHIDFWRSRPAGFDFSPARRIAANTGHPFHFQPDHLLSQPVTACSLDPTQPPLPSFRMEAALPVLRPGLLHGIGGWFHAQLSEHVTMTNSALADARINRRNAFFPIQEPAKVEKSDQVRVAMQIMPIDMMVSWSVEVWRDERSSSGNVIRTKKASSAHSILHGMLIAQDDLRRTRPDFVPQLSPRGLARLTVLTMCDGKRPLAEIEQEVLHRHPALFRTAGEAAAFVAEVVTRYAQ